MEANDNELSIFLSVLVSDKQNYESPEMHDRELNPCARVFFLTTHCNLDLTLL